MLVDIIMFVSVSEPYVVALDKTILVMICWNQWGGLLSLLVAH